MTSIAFWGSPLIAATLLEALHGHKKFKVEFVVSQPDKLKGRRKLEMVSTAVKKFAVGAKIPIFTPKSLKKNKEKLVSEFKPYDVDINVVLAYGNIIPEELCNLPRLKSVNFHASLLPKLRGAAPIEFALMQGMQKTGWTLQRIVAVLDAGDLIDQDEVEIEWAETRDTLYAKLTNSLLSFAPTALLDYYNGSSKIISQDESAATFCSKISTSMGELNFNKTAAELRNLYRSLSERPGVYSTWNNKKIKLKIDLSVKDLNSVPSKGPGTISEINEHIWLGCSDGCLPIESLQPDGKKQMGVDAFINGYQPKVGSRFGV